MRILLISTGLGAGGAERQVLDLASAFLKKGHSIKVVYLKGKASIPNIDQNLDIQKSDFDKSIFHGFLALIKIIKQYKPDIVHSHMFHANLITRLSRLFTNIPVLISTAHSTNEGGRMRMLGYRLTDSLADLTTNVSTEAVERYIKIKAAPNRKIIRVYNGIDLTKFQKNINNFNSFQEIHKKENQKILLNAGRLTEAKDQKTLIEAFNIAIQEHPNTLLLIAGEGDKRQELQSLIRSLNLEDKIHLLGLVKNIHELMNFCDLFILSSSWEGLPLVVGEAMACGKIVISTDCGGIKDYLDDRQWISPIKDPKKLAMNITKALNLSKEQSEKISKKNIDKIYQDFDLEKISELWLDIYQNQSKNIYNIRQS